MDKWASLCLAGETKLFLLDIWNLEKFQIFSVILHLAEIYPLSIVIRFYNSSFIKIFKISIRINTVFNITERNKSVVRTEVGNHCAAAHKWAQVRVLWAQLSSIELYSRGQSSLIFNLWAHEPTNI